MHGFVKCFVVLGFVVLLQAILRVHADVFDL